MTHEEKKKLAQELFGSVNTETIEAFKKYHKEKPEIMENFKKYAHEMRKTGRKRYSAKCIIERIRWDFDMKYSDQEFKISNAFTSLFVRLFIYQNPEFKEFFQLRKITGLSKPNFEKEDLQEI